VSDLNCYTGFRNVKHKYSTVQNCIFSVVLCGCETYHSLESKKIYQDAWHRSDKEDIWLRRDVVTNAPDNVMSSSVIRIRHLRSPYGNYVKNEMVGVCSIRGKFRNSYTVLSESFKGRNPFGTLGTGFFSRHVQTGLGPWPWTGSDTSI
jgi:hypothetical protein